MGHINWSSIGAEQQFVIQAFRSKVSPYRAVLFLIEETFFKTFHNFLFTFKISIWLIIYLVKAHTHLTISFIKTFVHPIIHFCPKCTYFRITGLPFYQHFTSFVHQRRGSFCFRFSFFFRRTFSLESGHQLFNFSFIVFIESYIIVTYQMIALFTGWFRSFTISIFGPCQHGFADMNTTVVHDIRLYHFVTVRHNDVGQGITQKVIAHMT